ncbi:hypothetical protein B0H11DRAFT_2215083 [Mycena galericulata]|nr:hypothetical protein B0H11DRAFT_2215083 [Mycena galericulata]
MPPTVPFRAKVARELFAALPESERAGYAVRAKEEAAERRAAFDAAMKATPSKSPEARQACIDNVGSFMGPILEGIRERTGLHSVIIMGGPIPKYGGELRSVYVAYGRNRTSAAEHFPQWGKERFDSVLEMMKEYLQTAFTPQDIEESQLPDGLQGAKYTMAPDAPSDSDEADSASESDSDSSDSDAESTDSNRDSEDSDSPPSKKEKRKEKKKEKQRANRKEKTARKQAQKENEGMSKQRKGKAAKEAGSAMSYQELRASIAQKAKAKTDERPQKRTREDEPAVPTRKSRRLNTGARDAEGADMEAQPQTPSNPPATQALAQNRTQGDSEMPPAPPDIPVGTPPPPRTPRPETPVATPPPETPVATPPPAPPPRIPVDLPSNCPVWLSESIAWLMAEDIGCHFSSLLAALVKLETKYGFDEDNRGKLPTAFRPAQVYSWIKGGRGKKTKAPPCINNVDLYAKQWAEWWDSMQPAWRTRDADGHWSVGGSWGPADQWDPLEAPGPNGCLSVVASLFFWGRAKTQSEELRSQWDRAVQDVVWMLEGLEASIVTGKTRKSTK